MFKTTRLMSPVAVASVLTATIAGFAGAPAHAKPDRTAQTTSDQGSTRVTLSSSMTARLATPRCR